MIYDRMSIPETILIIDDEIQIRRLLEITLAANGFETIEASTGKDWAYYGCFKNSCTHNP